LLYWPDFIPPRFYQYQQISNKSQKIKEKENEIKTTTANVERIKQEVNGIYHKWAADKVESFRKYITTGPSDTIENISNLGQLREAFTNNSLFRPLAFC
jgi:DNA uptake protein ComE-like DNA-binding protein